MLGLLVGGFSEAVARVGQSGNQRTAVAHSLFVYVFVGQMLEMHRAKGWVACVAILRTIGMFVWLSPKITNGLQ